MLGFIAAVVLAAPPDASGVDQGALLHLIKRCKEMSSWGLVVLKDGKTVCDYDFGKPPMCNLMSATKSITSMAVGALLTDGKLKTVDLPVCKVFPSFTGGKREKITIRNLLEHTSGLELYTTGLPDNRVADALKAKVVTEPGDKFEYNNRAVDLLSGVVRKLAGMPLDDYAYQRLFRPLGIKRDDFVWVRDPDGNPHGCAELAMRPRCMALLGQLMLQNGVWKGKRLLSEDYIKNATTATRISDQNEEGCGWLWWISQPYYGFDKDNMDWVISQGTFDAKQIQAMDGLIGKSYPNSSWMLRDLARVVGGVPKWAKADVGEVDNFSITPHSPSDKDGFFAEGWGGQIIFVLPSRGLVVVRTGGEGFTNTDDATKYEATDFYSLIAALAPPKAEPQPRGVQ